MNAFRSCRVALVLDPKYGEECSSLLQLMPIWIIDTSANRLAVEEIHKSAICNDSDLTTFQARDGETLAATCERIVQSLDDHFNEHSQSPAYTELNVVGVQLDEVSLPPFFELGFSEFLRAPTGFVAKKIATKGDRSKFGKA